MSRRFIYFDTETTGTHASKDRIIEIAAFDPKNNRSFTRLINPQTPIPPEAMAIHKITDEMVKDAPLFAVVIDEFIEFCSGDVVLVAHNNDSFDLPFVQAECKRTGKFLPTSWLFVDSLKWARKYRPDLPRHSLQFLRQIYAITANQAHRALDDVIVLCQVFESMIDDLTCEEVYKLLYGREAAAQTTPPIQQKARSDVPMLF